MSNINYPSWESGIPEKLPYINPYSSDNMYIELATIVQIWDWESITKHSVPDQLRLKYAWSYTEILKWLREEHKIFILIDIVDNFYYDKWTYKIKPSSDFKKLPIIKPNTFYTYEQAQDQAILYCLKLIKNENN